MRWKKNLAELKRKTARAACLALVFSFLFEAFAASNAYAVEDENERFRNTEVRVIRPRYFNKRKRLELGAQASGVMNEAFIYTFMASGLVAYHFTETFALEGAGSFGFSMDKEDKRILFEEFEIKTKIFRTLYALEANLQWTPIYGKWQFGSGRLIYFDTYLSFGGGMTGIDWKYKEFCTQPKDPNGTPIKDDQVKSYPTLLMGIGQRFFLNKDMAVRWDIRNHSLMYEKFDAECTTNSEKAETGGGIHHNITLQLGATKFF